MSSFGEDGRSIDAVNSVSDYNRRVLAGDELEEIAEFKPILSWWKEKNTEKQHIPSRKDFNPADFQAVLPSISISDTVFKDEEFIDLMPTVIGTALTSVYGEVTGKLVSGFENEYVVRFILDASRECLRIREPLGMTAKAVSEDMPFMRSFALYCPLASDHTHIDKVLIQVAFE